MEGGGECSGLAPPVWTVVRLRPPERGLCHRMPGDVFVFWFFLTFFFSSLLFCYLQGTRSLDIVSVCLLLLLFSYCFVFVSVLFFVSLSFCFLLFDIDETVFSIVFLNCCLMFPRGDPPNFQDHAVRVWTRAAERAAPAEVAQAYDKGVIDGQTKAKQVTLTP